MVPYLFHDGVILAAELFGFWLCTAEERKERKRKNLKVEGVWVARARFGQIITRGGIHSRN